MANMSLEKYPMPEQKPDVRNKNFDEVALGYTEEMAVEEAQRCLNCINRPCISGCPVAVRIPEFIRAVTKRNFEQAYQTIISTNALPGVCGRVCPQENQCEGKCIRGIKGEPVAIGRLERFVADWRMAQEPSHKESYAVKPTGHKIAVIGSGPAGLSCAGSLGRMGYEVTVFEAFHTAGGVLMYGIPSFRLPKHVVGWEINNLKELGVRIETNMVIGRILSVDALFQKGYDAVFIGTGAGLPAFLGIPGENLLGVSSANEFLTRINLMKASRDGYDTPIVKSRCITVVGGGNVAMDAARSAKRLGAETVHIVYRRSMKQLPARAEEVHHAMEEGIEFHFLSDPIRILNDEKGRVYGIECVKMKLGEPDSSGRRRSVEKKGSNFILETDSVIVAVGTSPNPLIKATTEGLETNQRGCIITDETMVTSRPGVFAGGDTVTGSATVIQAMGAGKAAAESIHRYLSGQGEVDYRQSASAV